MIGNIKLFLKNPTESRIYGVLNVNDKEAAVLKKMLEYYLEGLEDVKVRNLLYELFSDDNLKALENIDVIKNLLDEGWIIVSSFSQIKNSDLSMLEVFNSSISLSVAFLFLSKQGSLDLVIPKKTPYKDHLEYLHDQFLRIEIYEQLSSVKMNLSKESTSIKRLQSKLKLIENTIKEKIKKTKIDLLVQNFIEEYELNEKEEILFLALLKEE